MRCLLLFLGRENFRTLDAFPALCALLRARREIPRLPILRRIKPRSNNGVVQRLGLTAFLNRNQLAPTRLVDPVGARNLRESGADPLERCPLNIGKAINAVDDQLVH